MKRVLSAAVMFGILTLSFAGCSEKAETKRETTVSTPGGTTTTTETKEVKQTGDRPPAPAR